MADRNLGTISVSLVSDVQSFVAGIETARKALLKLQALADSVKVRPGSFPLPTETAANRPKHLQGLTLDEDNRARTASGQLATRRKAEGEALSRALQERIAQEKVAAGAAELYGQAIVGAARNMSAQGSAVGGNFSELALAITQAVSMVRQLTASVKSTITAAPLHSSNLHTAEKIALDERETIAQANRVRASLGTKETQASAQRAVDQALLELKEKGLKLAEKKGATEATILQITERTEFFTRQVSQLEEEIKVAKRKELASTTAMIAGRQDDRGLLSPVLTGIDTTGLARILKTTQGQLESDLIAMIQGVTSKIDSKTGKEFPANTISRQFLNTQLRITNPQAPKEAFDIVRSSGVLAQQGFPEVQQILAQLVKSLNNYRRSVETVDNLTAKLIRAQADQRASITGVSQENTTYAVTQDKLNENARMTLNYEKIRAQKSRDNGEAMDDNTKATVASTKALQRRGGSGRAASTPPNVTDLTVDQLSNAGIRSRLEGAFTETTRGSFGRRLSQRGEELAALQAQQQAINDAAKGGTGPDALEVMKKTLASNISEALAASRGGTSVHDVEKAHSEAIALNSKFFDDYTDAIKEGKSKEKALQRAREKLTLAIEKEAIAAQESLRVQQASLLPTGGAARQATGNTPIQPLKIAEINTVLEQALLNLSKVFRGRLPTDITTTGGAPSIRQAPGGVGVVTNIQVDAANIERLREFNTATEKSVAGLLNLRKIGSVTDRVFGNLVGGLVNATAALLRFRLAMFGFTFVDQLISGFLDFNAAIQQTAAIADASKEEIAQFETVSREVGRTTSIPAAEAAKALATLAQAGLTAQESIAALSDTIKLSLGTGASLENTVSLLTSTLTAFNLTTAETSEIANVFASVVNKSKATVEGLNTTFNLAAPAASAVGVSYKDLAAVIGVMANAGVKASTIGTSIRNVFNNLIAPSAKAAQVFDSMGISLQSINPVGKNLADVLEILRSKGFGVEAAFKAFGIRGAIAVAQLVQQADAIRIMRRELDDTQAVLKAFNTQQGSVQAQMAVLKNRVVDLGISFGQNITPVLIPIIKLFQGLTSVILSLSSAVAGFLLASTGLKGFQIIISALNLAAENGGTVWGKYIAALSIFNPVVLAIGAVIAAVLALSATWTLFTTATRTSVTAVEAAEERNAALTGQIISGTNALKEYSKAQKGVEQGSLDLALAQDAIIFGIKELQARYPALQDKLADLQKQALKGTDIEKSLTDLARSAPFDNEIARLQSQLAAKTFPGASESNTDIGSIQNEVGRLGALLFPTIIGSIRNEVGRLGALRGIEDLQELREKALSATTAITTFTEAVRQSSKAGEKGFNWEEFLKLNLNEIRGAAKKVADILESELGEKGKNLNLAKRRDLEFRVSDDALNGKATINSLTETLATFNLTLSDLSERGTHLLTNAIADTTKIAAERLKGATAIKAEFDALIQAVDKVGDEVEKKSDKLKIAQEAAEAGAKALAEGIALGESPTVLAARVKRVEDEATALAEYTHQLDVLEKVRKNSLIPDEDKQRVLEEELRIRALVTGGLKDQMDAEFALTALTESATVKTHDYSDAWKLLGRAVTDAAADLKNAKRDLDNLNLSVDVAKARADAAQKFVGSSPEEQRRQVEAAAIRAKKLGELRQREQQILDDEKALAETTIPQDSPEFLKRTAALTEAHKQFEADIPLVTAATEELANATAAESKAIEANRKSHQAAGQAVREHAHELKTLAQITEENIKQIEREIHLIEQNANLQKELIGHGRGPAGLGDSAAIAQVEEQSARAVLAKRQQEFLRVQTGIADELAIIENKRGQYSKIQVDNAQKQVVEYRHQQENLADLIQQDEQRLKLSKSALEVQVNLGGQFEGALTQGLHALRTGKGRGKDILKGLGDGIAQEFEQGFAKAIVKKLGFDKTFTLNMQDLGDTANQQISGGIQGGLQGGLGSMQQFATSALGLFGNLGGGLAEAIGAGLSALGATDLGAGFTNFGKQIGGNQGFSNFFGGQAAPQIQTAGLQNFTPAQLQNLTPAQIQNLSGGQFTSFSSGATLGSNLGGGFTGFNSFGGQSAGFNAFSGQPNAGTIQGLLAQSGGFATQPAPAQGAAGGGGSILGLLGPLLGLLGGGGGGLNIFGPANQAGPGKQKSQLFPQLLGLLGQGGSLLQGGLSTLGFEGAAGGVGGLLGILNVANTLRGFGQNQGGTGPALQRLIGSLFTGAKFALPALVQVFPKLGGLLQSTGLGGLLGAGGGAAAGALGATGPGIGALGVGGEAIIGSSILGSGFGIAQSGATVGLASSGAGAGASAAPAAAGLLGSLGGIFALVTSLASLGLSIKGAVDTSKGFKKATLGDKSANRNFNIGTGISLGVGVAAGASTGAAVGAAAGAPFFVIGAIPGAIIGAAVGAAIGAALATAIQASIASAVGKGVSSAVKGGLTQKQLADKVAESKLLQVFEGPEALIGGAFGLTTTNSLALRAIQVIFNPLGALISLWARSSVPSIEKIFDKLFVKTFRSLTPGFKLNRNLGDRGEGLNTEGKARFESIDKSPVGSELRVFVKLLAGAFGAGTESQDRRGRFFAMLLNTMIQAGKTDLEILKLVEGAFRRLNSGSFLRSLALVQGLLGADKNRIPASARVGLHLAAQSFRNTFPFKGANLEAIGTEFTEGDFKGKPARKDSKKLVGDAFGDFFNAPSLEKGLEGFIGKLRDGMGKALTDSFTQAFVDKGPLGIIMTEFFNTIKKNFRKLFSGKIAGQQFEMNLNKGIEKTLNRLGLFLESDQFPKILENLFFINKEINKKFDDFLETAAPDLAKAKRQNVFDEIVNALGDAAGRIQDLIAKAAEASARLIGKIAKTGQDDQEIPKEIAQTLYQSIKDQVEEFNTNIIDLGPEARIRSLQSIESAVDAFLSAKLAEVAQHFDPLIQAAQKARDAFEQVSASLLQLRTSKEAGRSAGESLGLISADIQTQQQLLRTGTPEEQLKAASKLQSLFQQQVQVGGQTLDPNGPEFRALERNSEAGLAEVAAILKAQGKDLESLTAARDKAEADAYTAAREYYQFIQDQLLEPGGAIPAAQTKAQETFDNILLAINKLLGTEPGSIADTIDQLRGQDFTTLTDILDAVKAVDVGDNGPVNEKPDNFDPSDPPTLHEGTTALQNRAANILGNDSTHKFGISSKEVMEAATRAIDRVVKSIHGGDDGAIAGQALIIAASVKAELAGLLATFGEDPLSARGISRFARTLRDLLDEQFGDASKAGFKGFTDDKVIATLNTFFRNLASLSTIAIPAAALGGITRGSTILKVGEQGTEAILPLSSTRLRPFADAMLEAVLNITSRNAALAQKAYGATGQLTGNATSSNLYIENGAIQIVLPKVITGSEGRKMAEDMISTIEIELRRGKLRRIVQEIPRGM